MKISSVLLLLLFTLGLTICRAQTEPLDVVTLRSGVIYKGTIAEYNPNDSTLMLLADGRRVAFPSSDIKTLHSAGVRAIRVKKDGFYHVSNLGLQLGNSTTGNSTNLMLNMLNGWKYNRSVVGIGTGFENLLNHIFVPLYFDYSYAFSDDVFTPFVSVQGGYIFNPGAAEPDGYYWNPVQYKDGLLLGAEVGIRQYLSEHFGLSFSLGYRYLHLSTESYPRYLFNDITYPVVSNAQLHRFSFKIGVMMF